MTATRRSPLLVRAGSAAALVLALAGCTPGGQFDPTTLFANDMFDTKTKLKGDREPVFPNGVPGASSGVPQDLVKGYQPPPDQAADANAPDAAAQEAAKNKPKPKPKQSGARAGAAACSRRHGASMSVRPQIQPRRPHRKARRNRSRHRHSSRNNRSGRRRRRLLPRSRRLRP